MFGLITVGHIIAFAIGFAVGGIGILVYQGKSVSQALSTFKTDVTTEFATLQAKVEASPIVTEVETLLGDGTTTKTTTTTGTAAQIAKAKQPLGKPTPLVAKKTV
jgi:hypothetical protein